MYVLYVEPLIFEPFTYISQRLVIAVSPSFTVNVTLSVPFALNELFDAKSVNDEGAYSVTVILMVFDVFAPLVAYTVYVPGVVEENDDECHELLMYIEHSSVTSRPSCTTVSFTLSVPLPTIDDFDADRVRSPSTTGTSMLPSNLKWRVSPSSKVMSAWSVVALPLLAKKRIPPFTLLCVPPMVISEALK